ncbi:MAG: 2-amino-4-hydroxy-6-hydroxymethyldihydropteridine diphosphokinase [Anaerolineales bacterium]
MAVIFIALGSNMGNRQANLSAAIEALEPEVHPIACSPVYETPPWGYLDQQKFLNQVVKAETQLMPTDLLDYIKEIEEQLGRQETFRNGPRSIDLDIIFYDQEVINSPPLTIPHPRMETRAFVLVPLADLAPHYKHPILGVSVINLLSKVDKSGIVISSPGGCHQQTE